MKYFAIVLAVLVLVGCGSDVRPPIDAAIDAPINPSIDAPAVVVDASQLDAAGLPEATPNYGADCSSDLDCSSDARCQSSVCQRPCSFGFCPGEDLHCHQGYCVWRCSDAYACPATTSCMPSGGYPSCL